MYKLLLNVKLLLLFSGVASTSIPLGAQALPDEDEPALAFVSSTGSITKQQFVENEDEMQSWEALKRIAKEDWAKDYIESNGLIIATRCNMAEATNCTKGMLKILPVTASQGSSVATHTASQGSTMSLPHREALWQVASSDTKPAVANMRQRPVPKLAEMPSRSNDQLGDHSAAVQVHVGTALLSRTKGNPRQEVLPGPVLVSAGQEPLLQAGAATVQRILTEQLARSQNHVLAIIFFVLLCIVGTALLTSLFSHSELDDLPQRRSSASKIGRLEAAQSKRRESQEKTPLLRAAAAEKPMNKKKTGDTGGCGDDATDDDDDDASDVDAGDYVDDEDDTAAVPSLIRQEVSRELAFLITDASSVLSYIDGKDLCEVLDAFTEARHYKVKANHPPFVAYLQYLATDMVQDQIQSMFEALKEGDETKIVTAKGLELMCQGFRIDSKNPLTGENVEGIPYAPEEYSWLTEGIQEPLSYQQFENAFVLWHAVALQMLEIKTKAIDEAEDIHAVEVKVSVRLPDGNRLFHAGFGWRRSHLSSGNSRTFIRAEASI